MSVLPNRQRAIASGSIGYMMQDLLQQLDLDYHRSEPLLVVRAELERLRQERSASTDVERRRKTRSIWCHGRWSGLTKKVAVASITCGGPGKVRLE